MLEAAFLAEHMVSKFNFHEMLERSLVCRAGPIGLMEVRMLGGELRPNAQVELLGERVLLCNGSIRLNERSSHRERPLAVPDLLMLASRFNLNKQAVFAALVSLIRRGFVVLTAADNFPSGSATS